MLTRLTYHARYFDMVVRYWPTLATKYYNADLAADSFFVLLQIFVASRRAVRETQMAVPAWLQAIRSTEIISIVQKDDRSVFGTLLGVPVSEVFATLGGGQADFTAPLGKLLPEDLALLYAYFLQLGHIEELVVAFGQHLSSTNVRHPIVIDLGCGPFTGGLAVASALEPPNGFSYIGLDRAPAMHHLGEKLAVATAAARGLDIKRTWTSDLALVRWTEPPRWRPVIVIASYLLASPTIDPAALVADVDQLLKRIGRGPLTLLYTNSVYPEKNTHFAAFRRSLEAIGLQLIKDEIGSVITAKKVRPLRYALFNRPAQETLEL